MPVVALGDLVAILVFVALGRASHRAVAGGPLLGTIVTAAPFLAGWAAAAAALGAYSQGALRLGRQGVLLVVRAWVVADAIALAIRSIIEGRVAPLSFVIVTLLVNGGLLLSWRAVYARLIARAGPRPTI